MDKEKGQKEYTDYEFLLQTSFLTPEYYLLSLHSKYLCSFLVRTVKEKNPLRN